MQMRYITILALHSPMYLVYQIHVDHTRYIPYKYIYLLCMQCDPHVSEIHNESCWSLSCVSSYVNHTRYLPYRYMYPMCIYGDLHVSEIHNESRLSLSLFQYILQQKYMYLSVSSSIYSMKLSINGEIRNILKVQITLVYMGVMMYVYIVFPFYYMVETRLKGRTRAT